MEFIIFVWIICPIAGAIAGSFKERTLVGFLMGLIFGPLGVIVSLGLDGRRLCGKCHTRLNRDDNKKLPTICPSCGTQIN